MTELEPIKHARLDSVKAKLVEMGFKANEQPREGVQLRQCVLHRCLYDVQPVCLTNDKLWLFVALSIFGIEGQKYNICSSFEIKGQMPDGDWGRVEIYGPTIDEIIPKLPAIEKKLIAAWKTICSE